MTFQHPLPLSMREVPADLQSCKARSSLGHYAGRRHAVDHVHGRADRTER